MYASLLSGSFISSLDANSCLGLLAFHPAVREAAPQWEVLLYVYATPLIPVLFSLLVGLNIPTWSINRINYQFIFGLHLLPSISRIVNEVW